MAQQISTGATLLCSFGVAPGTLMVLPVHQVMATTPAANLADSAPIVNILPFGACISPSNPTVAAATAAAMGVLTPMPCVPATGPPWTPGKPKVLIQNMPAVDNTCKAMCSFGGVIQVIAPGQFIASET
jgi:hypothetical protein